MEQEVFDLEAVYDNEISPLMTQIIEICKRHNIPFVASFCYEYNEEEGHGLCTSVFRPEGRTPDKYDRMQVELFR